jgi:signal transduction histidine kinase
MEIEKSYHRFTFSFVAVCYASIVALFWLVRSEWKGQDVWVDQIFILIVASFLLSSALFVFRKHWYIRFLFILKTVLFFLFTNIVFVFGYGAGKGWGLEISFMAILVVEISAFFALLPSVVLTSSIVGFTVLNVLVTRGVDSSLPPIPSSDVLALIAIAVVAGIAANVLRTVVGNLDRQIRMNERLDKAVSQLIDANIHFQNYAAAAGLESAHQERTRISRDIHDTAVHSLINIIMLAESIADKISADQTQVADMLGMVISQAKDAVKETRQSLRELRNMEDEAPRGLKAIHGLIAVFSEATGVEVAVHYGNLPWRFGGEIDETLYRMIQEGLTNAFRHGKATKIQINLWIAPNDRCPEIIVGIYDNGQGSQDIKKGIGLQGMEERIRKLNGAFDAKNTVGGFSINASIPLIIQEGGEFDEN